MTIYTRQQVREAVARALLLCPEAGQEAAEHAAAQSLGVPIELVREAIEPEEQPA